MPNYCWYIGTATLILDERYQPRLRSWRMYLLVNQWRRQLFILQRNYLIYVPTHQFAYTLLFTYFKRRSYMTMYEYAELQVLGWTSIAVKILETAGVIGSPAQLLHKIAILAAYVYNLDTAAIFKNNIQLKNKKHIILQLSNNQQNWHGWHYTMRYEIHLLLLRTEVPVPRELVPAMLSTSAPWTKYRRLEAAVQCTPCRRR